MMKEVTKPDVLEEEKKYRRKHFPDCSKVEKIKNLLCTSCNSSVKQSVLKGKVRRHPFLDTLLCDKCFSFYGDGDFSVDEDGSDKYCRWCGQGGTLYLCSKCTAGFCKKCIKRNLPRSVLKEVEDDDWQCLCCDVSPLFELRTFAWAAQSYVDSKGKKKSETDGKKKKRSRKAEKSDEELSEIEFVAASKKAKRNESSDGDAESRRSVSSEPSPVKRSSRSKKSKAKSRSRSSSKASSEERKSPLVKRSSRDKSSKDKSRSRSSSSESKSTTYSEADKLQSKQFKMARISMTTTVEDFIKLTEVARMKAVGFRKKRLTPDALNDIESFSSTAEEVTYMMKSVEDLATKLRCTFQKFVADFEETVKTMNASDNNGVEKENGEDMDVLVEDKDVDEKPVEAEEKSEKPSNESFEDKESANEGEKADGAADECEKAEETLGAADNDNTTSTSPPAATDKLSDDD